MGNTSQRYCTTLTKGGKQRMSNSFIVPDTVRTTLDSINRVVGDTCIWGGGKLISVACLRNFTIGHASLSRRSREGGRVPNTPFLKCATSEASRFGCETALQVTTYTLGSIPPSPAASPANHRYETWRFLRCADTLSYGASR